MKYTLAALASASLVLGHGYVENATINGQSYQFYDPNTDPYMSPTPERISRKIPGNGPVENVTSIDIQCNGDSADGIIGSAPAALHAPAAAGDNVTLYWSLWPDSHYGALVTYMARCPDTGCQDWLPNSTAVWFKIAEDGLVTYESGGGQNDVWAVDSLEVAGNAGYTYTIPSCLADGYYLVRHEIIAVFLASTYPGAQLYPGCHQLNITGGAGTTVVDDLVSFPGAYAGTDPGITWDSSSTTYPIPGPSVFSCAAAAGSGSDSASSAAVSSALATKTAAVSSSAGALLSSSSVAAVQTSVATTLATAVSSSLQSVATTSSAASVVAESSSSSIVVATSSVSSAAETTTSTAVSTGKKCSKRRGLQRNKQ